MTSRVALACALLAASSSGCFILFHDPEGSGGATSSSSTGTGQTASATNAGPGVSAAAATTGGGSCSANTVDDPNNCGACGHVCEGGCAHGVCQGVEVGTLPEAIALLAANDSYVFTVGATNSGTIRRFPATLPANNTAAMITNESYSSVHDAAGFVTAGIDGTAYYAPQASPATILSCGGQTFTCQPVNPLPQDATTHYNGLYFENPNLFALAPDSTSVWRFDGTMWFQEFSFGAINGHTIDARKGVFGWSQYAFAPCVGTVQMTKVTNGTLESVTCSPVYGNEPVYTMAIGGNGLAYSITAGSGANQVLANGNRVLATIDAPTSTALDTDDNALYLSNAAVGHHGVIRCDYNDLMGDTCVELSDVVAEHIVVTNKYVWFSFNNAIFRSIR